LCAWIRGVRRWCRSDHVVRDTVEAVDVIVQTVVIGVDKRIYYSIIVGIYDSTFNNVCGAIIVAVKVEKIGRGVEISINWTGAFQWIVPSVLVVINKL